MMTNNRPIRQFSLVMFILCLCIGLCSCQSAPYQKDAGEIFHTTYHISYRHANNLHLAIQEKLHTIDASLSMFRPESTLSRINAAPAGEVFIGDDTLACRLIEQALTLSELTEGAFDITVAPLVNFWGFGVDGRKQADPRDIDSLKQFVGYHNIRYHQGVVSKACDQVKLDASAIAKGYACDVVADLLESYGIQDYLVEIGGELRLSGHNPRGEAWRIGIDKVVEDPLAVHRELQDTLSLTNTALATSGNYRNFYLRGKEKIGHTIDPRTGFPARHSLLSATVVCPDCLTADALATAFMVMGKDQSIALLQGLPHVQAYLIYSDEQGHHQHWTNIKQ